MGEVYRARDERLHRFRDEARAVAALSHPNILVLHEIGEHDGAPYLVTELLDGETLRARLERGPPPRAEALRVAHEAAKGLAAAHARELVHRDVKPANLFLCADGRVKLLDFGLARRRVEGPAGGLDPTQTASGAVLGTVAYMAPEQVRGERADARSDVFALGVVLYEMLAGRRPFGGSDLELASAILRDEPPPLADPMLDALVSRCLAKNPRDRFQSALDLSYALEPFLGRSTPPPPARPRRVLPVVAVAAVGASFAAGLVVRAPPAASPPRYTRVTFQPSGVYSRARFGDDGKIVLYTHRARVRAAVPGQPDDRALTDVDSQLVAASGYEMLLLVRGPGGRPVLARAALAGGAPRMVHEDVVAADLAPDGRQLAVVRELGGRRRLEYPAGRELVTTTGEIRALRISPDGGRVAFLHHAVPEFGQGSHTATGTVESVDAAGRRETLSRPWSEVDGLAWSPGGDEVWVSGRRGALRQIYALALDGAERRVLDVPGWVRIEDIAGDGRALVTVNDQRMRIVALPPGASGERELSWFDQSAADDLSRDGTLLLFHEGGESTQERTEVYVRATDGSPAIGLGEGHAFALSPDGRRALIAPGKSYTSLALMPIGAGETRALPPGPLKMVTLAWFLDGERIVLRARAGDGVWRIWTQDLSAGPPRLVHDAEIAVLSRPAPDGSAVAACAPDGACAIYPVDGGAARPISPLARGDRILGFTADGAALILGRSGPAHPSLIARDLATGGERTLRELPAEQREPGPLLWHRFAFTPDLSAYAYSYWRTTADLYVVDGLR
jgi:hypothetical protein